MNWLTITQIAIIVIASINVVYAAYVFGKIQGLLEANALILKGTK